MCQQAANARGPRAARFEAQNNLHAYLSVDRTVAVPESICLPRLGPRGLRNNLYIRAAPSARRPRLFTIHTNITKRLAHTKAPHEEWRTIHRIWS